jgi:hypothetical protein
MGKAVYVGLSGPTYYDYRNQAPTSRNDTSSSPNPILENAFGLAVFYDEIWFLCESLCPQSLRGHPNVRYVDHHFREDKHEVLRHQIRSILKTDYYDSLPSDEVAVRKNFDQYSQGLLKAGVSWGATGALDNHSHSLEIMGAHASANSNRISCLHQDLKILELLQATTEIDISLNSFGQNLHKVLLPSEYDPTLEIAKRAQLGTYIINAKIENLIDIRGPDSTVFEKIHENAFVKDFRKFLMDKDVVSAGEVYRDVINEIEEAEKQQIRKAARDARPVKGLVNIALETAIDLSGLGAVQKLGNWYVSSATSTPLGAGAFLIDLEDSYRS